MKRLIKYWNPYEDIKFSNCSTRYEVLPHIVDDNAGNKELRKLAKELGFSPIGNCKDLRDTKRYWNNLFITNTVKIEEKQRLDYYGNLDTRRPIETVRLGFITIPELDYLPIVEKLNGELDFENFNDIFNYQDLDMRDFIELGDDITLLIESWNAYHYLDLMGYNLENFLKDNDIDGTVFDDSVIDCDKCGTWDYRDNGYTYNYRIVDGMVLGTNVCDCHNEYTKENFEDRIDDTDTPLELDTAEDLESEGKLEHLERFIGGMTDGRGGWYAGKSCREGNPVDVLEEYKEKYPNASFIFSHDESGQFQTYFSIWQVVEETPDNVIKLSEARNAR